jgi:hypothetical protein
MMPSAARDPSSMLATTITSTIAITSEMRFQIDMRLRSADDMPRLYAIAARI